MAIWTTPGPETTRFNSEPDYIQDAKAQSDDVQIDRVIVDLGGIQTIRSSDLNELIALQAKLRNRGGSLVLANVPAPIYEVFQLTRLNRLFTIELSEEPQVV